MLAHGQPRIIGNLDLYLEAHPRSRSTKRLVQEGVRSNLTCPLSVEGRVVGFIFRSSRRTHTYRPRHIELQMAITERLSQAVEKAWRIEQLEEANYAYTQMLGFVSHELKSPVASMVTDAQLLEQGYLGELTEAQQGKLDGITRKGQYLLGLVNEYLDLARVEGGELQLERCSRVDVNEEVVEEALELVRPQLDAHGMQLVTEMPMAGSALVCCDPTLLRIVLVNLLDNAVKYGNDGGEVKLTRRGRAGAPRQLRRSSRSRCATRGRASARRRRTSCSGASRASTTRPSRTAAAPASGSTTRGASSSCTKVGSPPSPSTASGRSSVSRYRRRRSARDRRASDEE